MRTVCKERENEREREMEREIKRERERERDQIKKKRCRVKEREERNVLFNDALNTFYLQLYGVRHMVMDHSYSQRRNLLLVILISSKRSYHISAFVNIVVEHWLE